jgi:aminoglycoside phosphotransferase (APT) family kinase protein
MSEPDDPVAHRDLARRLFPSLAVGSLRPLGTGWDCFTYEVDDEWILQLSRHAPAEDAMRRQIALLPELSRELSAPIPVPELWSDRPPAMVYRKLEGTPLGAGASSEAERGILPERMGRFLYDLHLVPLEFVGLRGGGPSVWRQAYREQLARFRDVVVPLLDADEAARSLAMFGGFLEDDANFRFPDALVHADLAPEHVLMTEEGDLAGVIDWGDATPGDPAIDFAWLVHGAPGIGERALAAYGGAPDKTFLARAAFYHALAPWYEAHFGVFSDRPSLVRAGLDRVRGRLPEP